MGIKKIKGLSLITSVVMIVLFAACNKPHYNQLTDDEMTWLAYRNNEVLKYSNGSTNIMSYYVTLRTKAYENQGSTYNEFTSANFLQLHDTSAVHEADSKGSLLIFKSELGLEVTFVWPHFPLSGIKLTNIVPSIATIGGESYNDVYVVDGSAWTSSRYYISKVWVSKSKGLVQYTDISGNTWVRNF